MKLYIKQKVFSLTDKFTIKDENGQDKYYVEGEFLTIGHKLHVYNSERKEVAFIKQKILSWMPRFEVYIDEKLYTTVVKEFTFMIPKYVLKGLDWSINGDIMQHEYTVNSNNKEIIKINKAWFSWGDSYELTIADNVDEVVAIATVLAIDCVLESKNNNSNSSS